MNIFGTCFAYAAHIAEITRNVSLLFVLNVLFNVVLALTATLGNGMIILAILRSQNLQTPSYLLITSLAFTDLLVGVVYHPLQILLSTFFLQNNVQGICAIFKMFNFVSIFLGVLSFMMVTCISIDRYLALRLRHRYRVAVTKKRVRLLIVVVWMIGFGLASYSTQTNLFLCYGTVIFSILVFFLVTTCVFYFKALRALRIYTSQVHVQQPNPLSADFDVLKILKYKKLLKTMFAVFGCLLFCFLPIVCSHVTRLILELSKGTVSLYFVAHTILGFNSSINPVIYLLRFIDIRHACRELASIYCSSMQ